MTRIAVLAAFLAAVAAEVEQLGCYSLPDSITRGRPLGPGYATDHPTATLMVYRSAGMKRVVDYHGCFERSDQSVGAVVGRLRQLESQVDSAAGSSRWVRPAARRP